MMFYGTVVSLLIFGGISLINKVRKESKATQFSIEYNKKLNKLIREKKPKI